jgi:hypothetical protein
VSLGSKELVGFTASLFSRHSKIWPGFQMERFEYWALLLRLFEIRVALTYFMAVS